LIQCAALGGLGLRLPGKIDKNEAERAPSVKPLGDFAPSMIRAIITSVGLILLCSCATQKRAAPNLPAEVALDKDAGRGGWVKLKLRLESGEELPFVLDTGSPITILDKSLEPELGKRLGTRTREYAYYGSKEMGWYRAPKLYLGDVPMQTGERIFTDDLAVIAGRSVKGILGMDCLRHYCVQMDFAERQMRFLDPKAQPTEDLGTAFPLTIIFGVVFARADFFGAGKAYFRPDTGAIGGNDATLTPRLFRRELQKQKPIEQWQTPGSKGIRAASFSQGVFGGQSYSNLIFTAWSSGPWWKRGTDLNLQFLARNLVTFNFPKRMMYLKQQSARPLALDYFVERAAEHFLVALKNEGRLPGCRKEDQGGDSIPAQDFSTDYPVSRTFDFQRTGESLKCHYFVVQASPTAPWKLQRAWQTDAGGRIIQEFPGP
jgi:hypothetical protein